MIKQYMQPAARMLTLISLPFFILFLITLMTHKISRERLMLDANRSLQPTFIHHRAIDGHHSMVDDKTNNRRVKVKPYIDSQKVRYESNNQ